MKYVRIINGVVDKIEQTEDQLFVFSYKKAFSLWIRVDQLEIVPQMGWKYVKETGFSE